MMCRHSKQHWILWYESVSAPDPRFVCKLNLLNEAFVYEVMEPGGQINV